MVCRNCGLLLDGPVAYATVPVSELKPSDARVPMREPWEGDGIMHANAEAARAYYAEGGIVPKILHRLEDLRALEWGSVVLDRNQHVWQTDSEHIWHGAQDDFTYTDAEFIAIVTGPYTLVWTPE